MLQRAWLILAMVAVVVVRQAAADPHYKVYKDKDDCSTTILYTKGEVSFHSRTLQTHSVPGSRFFKRFYIVPPLSKPIVPPLPKCMVPPLSKSLVDVALVLKVVFPGSHLQTVVVKAFVGFKSVFFPGPHLQTHSCLETYSWNVFAPFLHFQNLLVEASLFFKSVLLFKWLIHKICYTLKRRHSNFFVCKLILFCNALLNLYTLFSLLSVFFVKFFILFLSRLPC